jgi:hypothetical protein
MDENIGLPSTRQALAEGAIDMNIRLLRRRVQAHAEEPLARNSPAHLADYNQQDLAEGRTPPGNIVRRSTMRERRGHDFHYLNDTANVLAEAVFVGEETEQEYGAREDREETKRTSKEPRAETIDDLDLNDSNLNGTECFAHH